MPAYFSLLESRRRAPFALGCGIGILLLGATAGCRVSQSAVSPPSAVTDQSSFRRPSLDSWRGKTPTLDGNISPGEWTDATAFTGVRTWTATFSPVADPGDLSLRGWVKHDATHLHFAFEITDDRLYAIDTPRWLPTENPQAHTLTREGYPWLGDELEILLNGPNTWRGDESAEGSGAAWQMVCNLTKSRLGGLGVGGLLEGEPRTDPAAWATYQTWIQSGAQRAATRVRAGGYVVEWSIRFDPCVLPDGRLPYSPSAGDAVVGLNLALGDLDEFERGAGNFGNFHHEQWWAGAPQTRTQKNNFGTLRLHGQNPKPSRR